MLREDHSKEKHCESLLAGADSLRNAWRTHEYKPITYEKLFADANGDLDIVSREMDKYPVVALEGNLFFSRKFIKEPDARAFVQFNDWCDARAFVLEGQAIHLYAPELDANHDSHQIIMTSYHAGGDFQDFSDFLQAVEWSRANPDQKAE
jgi:hypothetical protein